MKTLTRMGLLLALFAWLGCSETGCSTSRPPPATITTLSITLATTTSTQDSGLLDDLLPAFQQQTGIEVKVVAVGSGQALELGRRGDADVLLTHSPAAESKFMGEGWGSERRPVMHNDFVVVGPLSDPAQVKQKSSVSEAFLAIAQAAQPFVSRGDESGTHQKELEVWQAAQLEPSGNWYIKAGAGMGQVLRMAGEKQAYVLADRATYLAMKRELELVVLLQGDPRLLNHYTIIMVNKARHPHVHDTAARTFAAFLTSGNGRNRIAAFGVDKFGEPLFVPAVRTSPMATETNRQ